MTYDMPHPTLVSARFEEPLAVFVDGENLQSWASEQIFALLRNYPEPRICRVYGNFEHLNGWRNVPGFEIIHTGVPSSGGDHVKNAADIKIAVDVMEFALRDDGRTVFLCSSDRDFTPLIWALRRLGVNVVGVGEAKATDCLQDAFGDFEVLLPPEKSSADCQASSAVVRPKHLIDTKIFNAAVRLGARGKGALLSAFNSEMRKHDEFKISSLPNPADRQWRKYFSNRPDIYRVDPKGQDARVHIIQVD